MAQKKTKLSSADSICQINPLEKSMVKAHLGPNVDLVWANFFEGLRVIIDGKHWGREYAQKGIWA